MNAPSDDEADVNHAVRRQDKEHVLNAALDARVLGRLRAGDTSRGVFGTDTDWYAQGVSCDPQEGDERMR